MSASRRFELLRVLGAGAYGTVYLADMVSSGDFRKKVALKLLKAQSDAELEKEAAQRLRDEARLLGRLRHRHIVQVDDLVRLDGQWAVVMEYVPGLDLEVMLEASGQPLPARAAAEAVAQAAGALDAAWRGTDLEAEPLHVIHRDIKPSNMRLTRVGDIKVLDFGIARVEMPEREAATGQYIMGTPNYIAPERLLGDLDAPSGDIYSLGGVLYELLVGTPLGRVQLQPAKQLAQVRGAVDRVYDAVDPCEGLDDLLALLEQMLSYAPEERPPAQQVQSRCTALASRLGGEDLVAFAGRALPELLEAPGQAGEPTTGILQEGPSPTLSVQPVDLAAPGVTTTSAQPRPAWVLGAGLAAAVALALGAGWWLGRGDDPTPPAPAPAPVEAPAAPVAETAPEPEPEPEPVQTAPPSASPEPSAPAAPKTTSSASAKAPTTQEPASDGPRLRAVKFVQEGGSSMDVRCGDVRGSGEASVLLRNVPAGRCQVTVDGKRAKVQVDEPRGVDCSLERGVLRCR